MGSDLEISLFLRLGITGIGIAEQPRHNTYFSRYPAVSSDQPWRDFVCGQISLISAENLTPEGRSVRRLGSLFPSGNYVLCPPDSGYQSAKSF